AGGCRLGAETRGWIARRSGDALFDGCRGAIAIAVSISVSVGVAIGMAIGGGDELGDRGRQRRKLLVDSLHRLSHELQLADALVALAQRFGKLACQRRELADQPAIL